MSSPFGSALVSQSVFFFLTWEKSRIQNELAFVVSTKVPLRSRKGEATRDDLLVVVKKQNVAWRRKGGGRMDVVVVVAHAAPHSQTDPVFFIDGFGYRMMPSVQTADHVSEAFYRNVGRVFFYIFVFIIMQKTKRKKTLA